MSMHKSGHERSSTFPNVTLLRSKTQGVAGAFMNCFNRVKPDNEEDSISQSNSSSKLADTQLPYLAASRSSTVSSSTHSQVRYNSSYSKNDTRKELTSKETTKFSTTEMIYEATGNFSTENIIGQGGFGIVYKGKLKDGSLIAVKRARKKLYNQLFKNEIHTLSKVEHLNLVKFLGWLEHDGDLIILLEYVGNGTLWGHLHGNQGEVLELPQRLDIAIDVAHAITYLHMYIDDPIIHRDIKACNVLLTEKLRAKVTDFGSAHLASGDMDVTHVSTDIKGSAGYIDPEYLQTHQLTEYLQTHQLTDKSDVYSFGVLLIELVTGRNPIERKREPEERITAKWV